MNDTEREKRQLTALHELAGSAAGAEVANRTGHVWRGVDILIGLVPYSAEELTPPPVITGRPVEQAPAPVYSQQEADTRIHAARRTLRNVEDAPHDQIDLSDDEIQTFDQIVAADEVREFNDIAEHAYGQEPDAIAANTDLQIPADVQPGFGLDPSVDNSRQLVDQALMNGGQASDMGQMREPTNA